MSGGLMVFLLLFPGSVVVLAAWLLIEYACGQYLTRRRAVRPVATVEHLVHDRYMLIGDLYDTPLTRGGI
ncbi:hypothetical protein [Streptomyces violaceusniger]|uniref:hypothetical protein n=1 Tax=Streptomyces violaceusniger TaxID=68280 RepID=UPI0037F47C42